MLACDSDPACAMLSCGSYGHKHNNQLNVNFNCLHSLPLFYSTNFFLSVICQTYRMTRCGLITAQKQPGTDNTVFVPNPKEDRTVTVTFTDPFICLTTSTLFSSVLRQN